MQNRDSGQLSNDSYEIQEGTDDSFIHVNPLTTSSQQGQYIELSTDLADYINGLYRLLDLCSDEGSNGIVDKIIISKEYLMKLCNDWVPSSFKSISEINYTELNSISLRLIGCYGNRNLIAKFLLNKNIIDHQSYDLLTASVSNDETKKPSLRPGIYLLKVNSSLSLIIHWPEIGCYENTSSDSFSIKKNMVNLHRYLTKLTDHQMCFMSDKDLETFDLNLENSDNNSDEDDDAPYRFEVKKSQEEKEDFKIDNGFKVDLSSKIKFEINNQMEDDVPLHPIVVESTTNQSFVTQQLIKKTLYFKQISSYISAKQFPGDLKTKLQDRYLHIDRNKMDINALQLFVKHGLNMDEPLVPLHEELSTAKKQNELRKIKEKKVIDEDIKIIEQMKLKILCAFDSLFDDVRDSSSSQTNTSDTDFERIRTRYPGIENKIKEKIKINSRNWEKMKIRYYLTCIVIEDILEKTLEAKGNDDEIKKSVLETLIDDENDLKKAEEIDGEMKKSVIETFYNMFTDDEADLKKLLEKYQTQQSESNWISKLFKTSNATKAKKMANEKSDEVFIQELVKFELFEGYDDIKEKIKTAFFKEYQEWKKSVFPKNFQEILKNIQNIRNDKQLENKLKQEYEEEKRKIEKKMFEKKCDEIETKYKDGIRLGLRLRSA